MKYFLLQDGMWLPKEADRWKLGRLSFEIESKLWEYEQNISAGRLSGLNSPIDITVAIPGKPKDFNFVMGAKEPPVVSARFKETVLSATESEIRQSVHFHPVTINVPVVEDDFYLMLIPGRCDAVDEERSEFIKFTEDDPVRPDLAGQYKVFNNLIINPDKAAHCIFRLEYAETQIIINEPFRVLLLENNLTGININPVNGEQQTVC
ncbi:imm11 family protein [Bacterioplanoides sp.]|uniref:imm11 family protein n=1 Tax=Bacterioplanoides sp. TaxID=2066072 RepID=UPI003B00C2A6